MFFGRKKTEKFLKETAEKITGLFEALQKQEADTADFVCEKIDELAARTGRHDNAITDLLETMEDLQDEQEKKLKDLDLMLSREDRRTIKSLEDDVQALLHVIGGYREQISYLADALAKDHRWNQQARIVREKLDQLDNDAGLFRFAQSGDAVNFDMHIVAEAVDTDRPEKNRIIQEVYEQGLIYHGKVVKKAVVRAYRYVKREAA